MSARVRVLRIAVVTVFLAACAGADEEPLLAAGQILAQLADGDGVMEAAGGHLLVLDGVDGSVGSLFTLHLPSPEDSPDTLVQHDQRSWFRPMHQVFLRDDVRLRGWYAVTAGPSSLYRDPDSQPAFGDPGQLLAVATLPEFQVQPGDTLQIEAELLPPGDELDFLTPDRPDIGGWGAEETAYERWWGDEPRPSSISILVDSW